jgi:GlcNAc-P-P-Und epimerase
LKIIITGANGWIGGCVTTHAKSLGLDVVAVDLAPRGIEPGVAYRRGDIGSDEFLSLADDRAVCDADAIIHCAGYAHRPHETPDEVARFYAINRDGTARVLELARRSTIRRVVYLSSIAFYDWDKGCDFDEDGPLATTSAYAGSKLAGEKVCRESELDCRVARLGTVFGIGDRANFAKLARALARRRFALPGRGEARKSVLPVGMAAELLVDLAVKTDVAHPVVNLALPEAPTLAQICAAYEAACGFRRARRIPVPLLRGFALAGDPLSKLRPSFPVTSLNIRKLTTSTSVKTDRMQGMWPNRRWGEFGRWLAGSSEYYRQVAQA